MTSSRTDRRTAIWIIGLYAVSGCAALVLEITWLRWFRLLFGATAPAASATLVAFFAGQALGAALAVRFLRRVRRPLAAYGVLELAAALCALAVPALLSVGESLVDTAYPGLQESPNTLTLVRFAIALAATLPTSLLVGATFPTVAAAWLASRSELATRATALYAVNLVGAAGGAALATFALPPLLGVAWTYGVGLAALATVGVAALLLGRAAEPRELPTAVSAPDTEEPRGAGLADRGRLSTAAFSGFGIFAFQVLLVRGLALVLDQSVFAFGATLVVVLLSLALGSAGVSLLLKATRVRAESALALALGVAGLGIAAFPVLLRNLTAGFDASAISSGGGVAAASLGLAAFSSGIPLLAAGSVLPLLFAAAGSTSENGAPETQLGRLLAVNTLGAIAGALVAPFLLLGFLQLWSSFLVVGFVYAVAAIFVPLGDRRVRLRRDVGLGFAWIMLLTRASPLSVEPVRTTEPEELVWVETQPAAVVTVVRNQGHLAIRTDNHYDLGGTRDLAHQERQGHVAGLLLPDARHALWIGSATGISAGALLAQPLQSLTLVELVPGVADAATHFFAPWNRGVHMDPRVRVVLDDARNFVRATDEEFDLVVADLFVPWRAGTGSLYASEHFEAVRAVLSENGAFLQWLPLYQLSPGGFASIAATFLDVFPTSALFRADFFGRFPVAALVGYVGRPPSPLAVSRATSRLAAGDEHDRWVRDPIGFWSLYIGPLAALAENLEAAPRNSDDRPRVEYAAPRTRARSAAGLQELLVGDRWIRATRPATLAIGAEDPVFPALPAVARRAAHAGAKLQAAGVAWVAGRRDEAASQMAAAAPDLPPALLDPDAPDESVAELWPERDRATGSSATPHRAQSP